MAEKQKHVESAHAAAFKKSETLEDTCAATIQGYDFNNGVNYSQLIQSMSVNGFQASNLGDAIKIVNDMLDWTLADEAPTEDCSEEEKDHSFRASVRCKVFLGFTSNLISSGVRENIRYLAEHHMVDVLVTTAGGVEEDLIKCLAPTYKCDSTLPGAKLHSKGLNRIGNLLVPNVNFCKFAAWIFPIFNQMLLEQTSENVLWTPSRLIARLGKEINNESSYLYWAYKNNIPVFCPGITDGALGVMLYFHSLCNPGLIVDVVQDIRAINNEAVRAGLRKTGMIILGGGMPKHHICNANLMRNGADYAVFINTGQEFDGSDSGARPDEAISWGKIKGGAKNVKVHCDATIAFPLLVAETFASRKGEVVHKKMMKNEKLDEKQKHVESAHAAAFKISETLESTCAIYKKHVESAHTAGSKKSESLESRCATIKKQKRLESAYAATFKKSETLESTCATIQGYDFNHGVNYSQLIKSMSVNGFQASNLGDAIHIVNQMLDWRLADETPTDDCLEEEKDDTFRASVGCKVFLGFTSNLISSGVRENIRYLVEHHMVDVVVTTAGGIEEDLIKCLAPTYKGDFALPGAQLRSKGLNRIGNLLVPNDNYCEFEKWIIPIFDKMLTEQTSEKLVWTPSRLIARLGKEINNESSYLYWAYKNNIPVFCPGITDGSLGDMLYFHSVHNSGLIVDVNQDNTAINDEAVHASPRKTGMIILGGGLPKHHIGNANMLCNGADYAVFINTGQEFDGSDSGASPEQAISWGKIKGDAKNVKVHCDATIAFPLLVAETFASREAEVLRKTN